MGSLDKPTYMELDGQVASMVPTEEGTEVSLPIGMSIADFMQDGSVITKEQYDKLNAENIKKYQELHGLS